MPQLSQYYAVLGKQLKPSFDIQKMGSSNVSIRSSTFGPQIRHFGWTDWQHKQNTTLTHALNRMNQ